VGIREYSWGSMHKNNKKLNWRCLLKTAPCSAEWGNIHSNCSLCAERSLQAESLGNRINEGEMGVEPSWEPDREREEELRRERHSAPCRAVDRINPLWNVRAFDASRDWEEGGNVVVVEGGGGGSGRRVSREAMSWNRIWKKNGVLPPSEGRRFDPRLR